MRRALLCGCAALAFAAAQPRPAAAQALDTDALLIVLIQRTIQAATQSANYVKGLMAGIQRTTDASNIANARFQRDVRNAQIRDEHIPTPAACEALDESMAAMVG